MTEKWENTTGKTILHINEFLNKLYIHFFVFLCLFFTRTVFIAFCERTPLVPYGQLFSETHRMRSWNNKGKSLSFIFID